MVQTCACPDVARTGSVPLVTMIPNEEITFVIQGPVAILENGLNSTEATVRSIEKFFPRSPIIFSTWEGAQNVPEGNLSVLFNKDPGPIDSENVFIRNYNRMLISTRNGFRAAGTKYAAKIRSDFFFVCHPEISNNDFAHIRDGKILMCMSKHHYPLFPFYISDWFQIGPTEILKEVWESSEIKNKEIGFELKHNFFNRPFRVSNIGSKQDYKFHSEQKVAIDFLTRKKEVTEVNANQLGLYTLLLSYLTLSKYFFARSRERVGLRSFKHEVVSYRFDYHPWYVFNFSDKRAAQIPLLLATIGFRYSIEQIKYLLRIFVSR